MKTLGKVWLEEDDTDVSKGYSMGYEDAIEGMLLDTELTNNVTKDSVIRYLKELLK